MYVLQKKNELLISVPPPSCRLVGPCHIGKQTQIVAALTTLARRRDATTTRFSVLGLTNIAAVPDNHDSFFEASSVALPPPPPLPPPSSSSSSSLRRRSSRRSSSRPHTSTSAGFADGEFGADGEEEEDDDDDDEDDDGGPFEEEVGLEGNSSGSNSQHQASSSSSSNAHHLQPPALPRQLSIEQEAMILQAENGGITDPALLDGTFGLGGIQAAEVLIDVACGAPRVWSEVSHGGGHWSLVMVGVLIVVTVMVGRFFFRR
jgi:hypothetical protein